MGPLLLIYCGVCCSILLCLGFFYMSWWSQLLLSHSSLKQVSLTHSIRFYCHPLLVLFPELWLKQVWFYWSAYGYAKKRADVRSQNAMLFSFGSMRRRMPRVRMIHDWRSPFGSIPGLQGESQQSLLLLVNHVCAHSTSVGCWICDTITVPSCFSMSWMLCKTWSLLRLMMSSQWLHFCIFPHFSCHQYLDGTGA